MLMRRRSYLEEARVAAVLTTIAIAVLATVSLALLRWLDWRVGFGLTLFANAALILYSLCWRDGVMGHLLLFGLVLGIVELAADAWLVDGSCTLDYFAASGPLIWRSPVSMPFVWQIIAVQFGCLGMHVIQRWGATGVLVTGICGALIIPFYEEIALRIHWWKYHNCRLLAHTPLYIILGDVAIAICAAGLAGHVRRGHLGRTMAAGAAGGLSVLICYAASYWLVDRVL